jgi:hypothetical protein
MLHDCLKQEILANNSDNKDTDFPAKCGVFNGHTLKA